MQLLELLAGSQLLFISLVVVLSAMVGSFLNVVIHRLPIMMEREWRGQCAELNGTPIAEQARYNLAVPRSACPHCSHRITALENIPVISYLFLKGKCASCQARISPRYPIIESVTALLSATIAWYFGFGWETLAALVLTWSLICLTMIDVDHQLLPDSITLPMLWLGLAINLFTGMFTDIQSALIGAMIGYLSLWSIYWIFKLLTGKEGMGYGDFKLLAMLGAWLGWQMLPVIILASSLVGAVVGISLVVMRGHERNTPIPFGPYLAAAGWIALIWGVAITEQYLGILT